MNRRRTALAVAIGLVVLALGWWLVRVRGGANGARAASVAAGGGAAGGGAGANGRGPGGAGSIGAIDGRLDGAAQPPAPAWFYKEDVPARRIAGRVLEAGGANAGQPIAGARVTLGSALTEAGFWKPEELRTGADGRFDFGVRRAASYQVSAQAPGHTVALDRVDLADPARRPAADALELHLGDCALAIYGHVRDAAGGPVAYARVALDGVAGVSAGADGAYELCLPGRPIEVTFEADGYGGVSLGLALQGRERRDVVLVPEGAIVGKVVRKDSGAPVADAYVDGWPFEWAREHAFLRPVMTDAQGRFRLAGVHPGRYRVYATADKLGPAGEVEVSVAAGAQSEEVVIALVARAQVSGKVVSAGKPVAGARVQVVKGTQEYSGTAYSQADGRFVIDSAPAGEVHVMVHEHDVRSPRTVVAPADDVVVEVDAQASIAGKVTRRGKPVAGASVYADRSHVAYSSADGSYRVSGLPGGAYDVWAESKAAGAFAGETHVTLGEGEAREHVDLELGFGGAASGVVVDQDGQPVAGAYVVLSKPQPADMGAAVTDEDGRFRATQMTGGGDYIPAVYAAMGVDRKLPPADGVAFAPVHVADASAEVTGVRLVVRRTRGKLAGRVVDTSGAPVADARVRASMLTGEGQPAMSSWLPLPSAITDAEGRFAFAALDAGSYAVEARASDGAEALHTPVAVPAGGEVRITLTRAGSIDGTLVGFTQTPVVYAQTVDGQRFVAGKVDGDHFQIAQLAPGGYRVTAQDDREGDAATVEVKTGAAAPLTLTSHGQGTILASVVDFQSKKPVAGARCRTVMAAGDAIGITNWDPAQLLATDASGKVRLSPVPAGQVVVQCEAPSAQESQATRRVTVPTGGEAEVELAMVTVPKDAMLGDLGFQLDWMGLDARVTAVRADGAAATAGLAPGDVIVSVDGAGVAGLSPMGVLYLVYQHPVGQSAALGVVRAGKPLAITLVMAPPR